MKAGTFEGADWMSVAVRVADALPTQGAVLAVVAASVRAPPAPAAPSSLPSDGDGLPTILFIVILLLNKDTCTAASSVDTA